MLRGLLSGQTSCASWQRGPWLRPSPGGCCGLGRRMRFVCRVVTAAGEAAEPDAVLQVPDPGFDDGLSSRLALPLHERCPEA